MTAPLTRCTLHEWTFAAIAAGDALKLAAGPLAELVHHGFTYTTATCRFCLLEKSSHPGVLARTFGGGAGPARLIEHGGDEVDLARVFELRLIGDSFELTWVRSGATGRLTVMTDDANAATAMEPGNLAHHGLPNGVLRLREDVRWRDHGYLVWGQSDGSGADGWTRLTAPRIGALWVPCKAGTGQRVEIRAREYFERQAFGNVVFVRERLLGLRVLADDGSAVSGGRQG